MSTLTNLPPDHIVLILRQLRWRDIYNFCKTNRTICSHPRIQQFIQQRVNEIVEDILNHAGPPYYLIPLNPHKEYTIFAHMKPESIVVRRFGTITEELMPQEDIPQYYFTEKDKQQLNVSNLVTLPLISSLTDRAKYNVETKVSTRGKREDIKKIIVYLLVNGEIDEPLYELQRDDIF